MEAESATSEWCPKNEIKSEYDITLNSCRLCMEKNRNMIDMFDPADITLLKKVEFCTGLKLTEEIGLPTRACETCLLNLKIAHEFKVTCLESDEKYRKQIIPQIKVEDSDGDFDNDNNHFDDINDDNDCKNILKEVLKLTDIKISRVKLKKENNRSNAKEVRKKRQLKSASGKAKDKTCKKDTTIKLKKAPIRRKRVEYNPLRCEICSIEFKNKEEANEHKKATHKEIETYICEICGKLMSSRASLYTHTQSHMPPRHACDTCDYKTWHKYDLVKHRRIHTGVKIYQCEFCTASYHTSSNLRVHIRLHHEGAPKRFACKLCDRSFFDRTKLRRHVDAHNDIKRHECEACRMGFTLRSSWKAHMYKKHGVDVPAARPGRQKTNLVVGDSKTN